MSEQSPDPGTSCHLQPYGRQLAHKFIDHHLIVPSTKQCLSHALGAKETCHGFSCKVELNLMLFREQHCGVGPRKARIGRLGMSKRIPAGPPRLTRTKVRHNHVTHYFTSHRAKARAPAPSYLISCCGFRQPCSPPCAHCRLGGAGIRHPHRNFQTTLKIQPPLHPVTVSKQPVTTTTKPQQWHESLTAVATRELPSSSRFHFDGFVHSRGRTR